MRGFSVGGRTRGEATPPPLWQSLILQLEYMAASWFLIALGLAAVYMVSMQRYQTEVSYRHLLLLLRSWFPDAAAQFPYKGIALLSIKVTGLVAGISVILGLLLQTLAAIRNIYALVGFGGQLLLFIMPISLLTAGILFWSPLHVPYWFGLCMTAVPSLALVPRFFSDISNWIPEWFGFGKQPDVTCTSRPNWVHERAKKEPLSSSRRAGNPGPDSSAGKTSASTPDDLSRRYGQILGLKGKVTSDEIRQRYLHLMAEYHPDKVNHLGPKLKALAEDESKKITEAYEYFRRTYKLD